MKLLRIAVSAVLLACLMSADPTSADVIKCTSAPTAACEISFGADGTDCDTISIIIPALSGCEAWGAIATEYNGLNSCCDDATWGCSSLTGGGACIGNFEACVPSGWVVVADTCNGLCSVQASCN